jgi:amino acid transporter
VRGDTVLVAIWTAVAAAEDIAEPKEPEVPAPTVTKENVDVRLANQTGNPILDVLNGNVPLGGFATKGAWSLLSLLMSLVAVIFSVLLVVGVFMRRREDDYEDEDRRRHGKILKTFTIIVGILTPIVWLILDNLNQPMVWINNWTVFVGITFIVHIALLVVYKLRKGNEEKEEEDNAEVA